MTQCVDCGKRLTAVHRCPTPGAAKFDGDRRLRDIAWYASTGHCGRCGQPGVFCLCTEALPCGCRDLHEMGSGLVDGALDQFSIDCDTGALVPTISDDQGELFG